MVQDQEAVGNKYVKKLEKPDVGRGFARIVLNSIIEIQSDVVDMVVPSKLGVYCR